MASNNSTMPCYKWGGEGALRTYTPCNPSAAYSTCCRTVQRDNPYPPETCLPNGLCAAWGMDVNQLPIQQFWIEACSDHSWKDPACAAVAKYLDPTNESGCYTDKSGGVRLGYCPDTKTYCCNRDIQTLACCNTTTKSNVVVNLPVASMAAITTSLNGKFFTTALPTLLSTSTGSVAGSAISPVETGDDGGNSKRLPTGTGAGISLGIVIGAIAAGLVIFCLLGKMRRKRQERKREADMKENSWSTEMGRAKGLPEIDGRSRHELDSGYK